MSDTEKDEVTEVTESMQISSYIGKTSWFRRVLIDLKKWWLDMRLFFYRK
jgi:hypothetical protein